MGKDLLGNQLETGLARLVVLEEMLYQEAQRTANLGNIEVRINRRPLDSRFGRLLVGQALAPHR